MSNFYFKSIAKFLSFSLKRITKIIVIIIMTFTFVSCSFISKADTQTNIQIDPEIEQQVLEVIRNNPQVILESLQNYQEQQRQQQEQQRQSLLDKMKNDPNSLIGESPTLGSSSAEIVMFEFSDFQCPFCSRASSTIKQFMDKHGNDVRLVYKHLPLKSIHPQATPAAIASWAAMKQGKFWEYHDALFENQNRLGQELYIEIAQSLNLDLEKFNRDRSSTEAETSVNNDIQLARELELTGTPTFILNGELFSGALSLADFEEKLAKIQGN